MHSNVYHQQLLFIFNHMQTLDINSHINRVDFAVLISNWRIDEVGGCVWRSLQSSNMYLLVGCWSLNLEWTNLFPWYWQIHYTNYCIYAKCVVGNVFIVDTRVHLYTGYSHTRRYFCVCVCMYLCTVFMGVCIYIVC